MGKIKLYKSTRRAFALSLATASSAPFSKAAAWQGGSFEVGLGQLCGWGFCSSLSGWEWKNKNRSIEKSEVGAGASDCSKVLLSKWSRKNTNLPLTNQGDPGVTFFGRRFLGFVASLIFLATSVEAMGLWRCSTCKASLQPILGMGYYSYKMVTHRHRDCFSQA